MKTLEVIVKAGRTFNHPYEQYSNLRADAEMRVALEEGEDAAGVIKAAQAQVEGLVEDHKQAMLRSIHELAEMRREEAELRGLQAELKRAQERMDEIRRKHPGLVQLPEAAEGGEKTR